MADQTTADSGIKRLQAFCGDCGTAIYATTVENRTIFNLRLGALKQSISDVRSSGVKCLST